MSKQDLVTQLEACKYSDLAKHTKVFNKNVAEYHLWIHLDPEHIKDAYFIEAEEIGPNADNTRIFPDTFVRKSKCWIRVNRGFLSGKPGKHTIKLSFVDRFTDTDFSLFASYYLQDDNPEKPYVYMKDTEEDNKCDCPTCPGEFTEYEDPETEESTTELPGEDVEQPSENEPGLDDPDEGTSSDQDNDSESSEDSNVTTDEPESEENEELPPGQEDIHPGDLDSDIDKEEDTQPEENTEDSVQEPEDESSEEITEPSTEGDNNNEETH